MPGSYTRNRLKSGDCLPVSDLVLQHSREGWPFADENRDLIRSQWSNAIRSNPRIFNGTIFPLLDHDVRDGVFFGDYAKSDFASYLYWRENGFCDPPTCDGFASVLLRSREGRYLFATAAQYTLNAGLLVPPGGMIDERDFADDGCIDAWQYGLRELREETGLSSNDVSIEPGFKVMRDGALIAFGLFCQSSMSEREINERFLHHNRSSSDIPELDAISWLSSEQAQRSSLVPRFVNLLLSACP
ncbi:MAG: NUDIX hydrolase [Hyphomicrobiaceae bacterium TMED74]|nr:hypothetical protein [Filomicrobium sp.]RPG44733.1 MAG: NUDIX hydrolase [Hyphomicrobiaceae bacterium TMED74]